MLACLFVILLLSLFTMCILSNLSLLLCQKRNLKSTGKWNIYTHERKKERERERKIKKKA